jgi:hypothetical protein
MNKSRNMSARGIAGCFYELLRQLQSVKIPAALYLNSLVVPELGCLAALPTGGGVYLLHRQACGAHRGTH